MNWKEDPRWAYVFVNLSCLMWASNIVLGRVLRGEIGPLTLTAFRYVVASLLYVAVLGRSVGKEPLVRRDWVLLAAMGLTGIFGFSALLYRGLQFTTATNGVLINGSGPLMTAVLAAILLKERLSRRHVLGALISFLGVALIVGGGSFRALLQWHVNTGDLYILMAMGVVGGVCGDQSYGHPVAICPVGNGPFHLDGYSVLARDSGPGVASSTAHLELAPRSGGSLHRHFPVAGRFPGLERRGAAGRAQSGDGLLQYAPCVRSDIGRGSARGVARLAAFFRRRLDHHEQPHHDLAGFEGPRNKEVKRRTPGKRRDGRFFVGIVTGMGNKVSLPLTVKRLAEGGAGCLSMFLC